MGYAQEWNKFIERCLLQRIPPAKFDKLAKLLSMKTAIPSLPLAEVLLKPRAPAAAGFDPVIPVYTERLLDHGLLRLPDVLRVLLKKSRYHHSSGVTDVEREEDGTATDVKWHNSPELEEMLLLRAARAVMVGPCPQTRQEALSIMKAASSWMSAVVASSTRDQMMQDMSGGTEQVSPEAVAVSDALGTFVVALIDNMRISTLMSGPCPKDLRRAFIHAISLYVPFILHTSPQTANRLEAFQRQYGAQDESAGKGIDELLGSVTANGLQAQGTNTENVIDGPLIYSRAGLYVFLNASLVGRPMADDGRIMNYLQARYQANVQTMAIELITASFDTLANATFRNEPRQTLFTLRSFLVNKVPVLLSTLSSMMFPPLTAEFCVTEALNHVDPQAFPSFSSMFDVSTEGDIFSDVRQEFLFACCLHQLIPEEIIERLLGDPPMQELPSGGRYIKDELVSQCATDLERVERLLGEIDNLDGNAGAVAGAVAEVIRTLCVAKEPLPLKSICSSLLRKEKALDVMLLFNSPTTILQPICQLLDSWHYEEDQGEYQPVYEEFGSILLLVLALVHRYDLNPHELGISSDDSFVARYLETGDVSRSIANLTEVQNKHLGGWIQALFDEGISDDLMSSCRPHEFYDLIPTLFSQVVVACKAGVMEEETMRGGLEYLLEASLLPSLVGAITWLTNRLWESQDDARIVLQILQALMKPNSIAGEAATLHETILSIIGKPLEHAIRELRRRDPSRSDLDPILTVIQKHLTLPRTPASHHAELQSWTSVHGGGLSTSLRSTFQTLVLWSQNPDLNMTPATYTHRQILVAVQTLGARSVLNSLVGEVKLYMQNGSGDLALDVATSLICAPSCIEQPTTHPTTRDVSRRRGRLTLRDALRLHKEELARQPPPADPLDVDVPVRLYRRVEAQFADVASLAAGAGNNAAAGRTGVVSADMMQEIDAAAVAAVVADVEAAGGAVDGRGGPGVDNGLGGIALDGLEGLGGMDGMGMGDMGIGQTPAQDIDDVLGGAGLGMDFGSEGMQL